MKFTYALACAGLLTVMVATPVMAQRQRDNATIEGTETDPGSEGMPSAADKFGNLSSMSTGTTPIPRSDVDSRGGPLPAGVVNNSSRSVFETPGGMETSSAK